MTFESLTLTDSLALTLDVFFSSFIQSGLIFVLTVGVLHVAQVVVSRCDVTVREDVSNALAAACSSEIGLPPVRGIVHAACPPQQGGGDDGDASPGGDESGLEQRFLETKVRRVGNFENMIVYITAVLGTKVPGIIVLYNSNKIVRRMMMGSRDHTLRHIIHCYSLLFFAATIMPSKFCETHNKQRSILTPC